MTPIVHNLQPFTAYTLLNEGIKKNSRLQRIKNVLTGRVFENWREQLLSVATVYYIIKAVVSFFTGHWIVSFIELGTAMGASILRKDIHDFTNFHKATASYREQNMEFALNNLDLRKGVKELQIEIPKLQKEVGNLREERKKFQTEVKHLSAERRKISHEVRSLRSERKKIQAANEDYAYNNAVLKHTIETFERSFRAIEQRMQHTLASNQKINKRMLNTVLEEVNRIQEERALLKNVTGEIREEHQAHLKQLGQIVNQVQDMGNRQIQMVHEADEELRKTQVEIRKQIKELAHYSGQAEILKQEVDHLTGVRRDLQIEINRLQKTVDSIVQAANSNMQPTGFALSPKGFNDKSEFSFDWILGIALIGFVAKKVLFD